MPAHVVSDQDDADTALMVMCSIVGTPASMLTFNGSASLSTAASFTFTNVQLGDEAPDRLVVIGVSSVAAAAPTSVTLNGTPMTLVVRGAVGTSAGNGIYSLAYPSGTSATLVITFASAVGGGLGYVSYSAYNLEHTAAYGTAFGHSFSPALTINCSTPSNGVVLAVGAGISATASSLSGIGTDLSAISGGGMRLSGHANDTVSAAPLSITSNMTSATAQALVAASFA